MIARVWPRAAVNAVVSVTLVEEEQARVHAQEILVGPVPDTQPEPSHTAALPWPVNQLPLRPLDRPSLLTALGFSLPAGQKREREAVQKVLVECSFMQMALSAQGPFPRTLACSVRQSRRNVGRKPAAPEIALRGRC